MSLTSNQMTYSTTNKVSRTAVLTAAADALLLLNVKIFHSLCVGNFTIVQPVRYHWEKKCTYQLQTAARKSLCCGNPEWESWCRKEEYLSRHFYHYLLCSFSLIRVSVPIKSLFLSWVIYSTKDVGESWYADKVHIVFLGCLYKSRFCSKTSFVFTN